MMALLVSRLVRELLSRLHCYTTVLLATSKQASARRARASAAERVIVAWRTTAQYSRVVTQNTRVTQHTIFNQENWQTIMGCI